MLFNALRKITRIPAHAITIVCGFPEVLDLSRGDLVKKSYYPEAEHKSRLHIFGDNLWWLIRHNEANHYYYTYGFDRKHAAHQNEYLPNNQFGTVRDRYNKNAHFGRYQTDYTCLLKDKFVFSQMLNSLGIPTPQVLALCENGELIWSYRPDVASVDDLFALPDLDVFCKVVLGECADAVFPVSRKGQQLFISGQASTMEVLRRKLDGKFIVQRRVQQHPAISALYPHSVNTIRLITFNKNGKIIPFSALLRIGANGNLSDNWAIGGLVGMIDIKTGRISGDMLYKPGFGGRVQTHPNTGLTLDSIGEIPFFHEAIDMAIKLHRSFYGIVSVGWDVAITPDGPCFIEGNDNWEMALHQMHEGGWKRRFYEALSGR